MKATFSETQIRKLTELAAAAGVQTSYDSAFGNKVFASPESLIHVINAATTLKLSEDLSNLDALYQKQLQERWTELTDPVLIAWEGKPFKVSVRARALDLKKKAILKLAPEGKKKILSIPLNLTQGETITTADLNGEQHIEKSVTIKKKLPFGYYKGVIQVGKTKTDVFVISSPWNAYRPKNDKNKWLGVFAPLYAVRTERTLALGNLSDLRSFLDWAYKNKFDFVGTLPMLSIFNDRPLVEPSPYSPLSRLHWNEMYVDPRITVEWKQSKVVQNLYTSAPFQKRLSDLNSKKEVDYRASAQLKRELLEILSEDFFKKKKDASGEFKKFLKLYPTAVDYAEFRATCETRNAVWSEWPEPLRSGKLRAGDYNPAFKRYHLYVQFLAHQQLSKLGNWSKTKGKGIYIDFPLSAHADGYDVWRERESFGETCSAGCPPDPAHVHGQDWGILPLNPNSIRYNGYRYFRRCLMSHMRYAGMLRLDHVMCFYRLYWVPRGLGAKNGVYIRYKMEEFFALLILESHRNRCVLIGEDLGTVPPEIRQAMTEHKILRMYVQQRRLSPDMKEPLPEAPEDCICSLNTHDMPPFAAFWQGLDILDKMDLGYFGENELPAKNKTRADQRKSLISFLIKKKLLKNPAAELSEVLRAILKYTASDKVKIMQLNIEDLWLETLPQNVPGTWKERPNWRRRWRHSLEELAKMSEIQHLFKELTSRRQK